MKRSELKLMKSALLAVNPFMIPNEKGESLVFFSKREAYLFLLHMIRRGAADNYIELEYVLTKIYLKRYSEIHSLFVRYFVPLGIREYMSLELDVRKNKSFYRDFAKALHSYCDTSFDTSQFDYAFNEFVADIEKDLNQKK